ncbi:DNA-binding protein [Chryseobacterium piscium]|uniref:DNA-binding protein n=1 Tax=Chryseobacterium piscium TaxID=333702 RepID=A0A3D9BRW8_9FLAO|nr:XRE family transcriptional regulator [Chryseobacterium piscium]REC56268.1 DNA-binding protein [Chryseobacterium piscium]
MKSSVAQRIKNSRIHKGFSQQEVADHLGVSKQMISKYEMGKSLPESSKIIKLSKLFGQKPDYFFRKAEVEIGEISFRKKSSLGTKKVNALKEEVRICIENYIYVENILGIQIAFENPLKDFKIKSEKDITTAADLVKEKWNIGSDAIYNIIELFEDKHIKVIEVDDDSSKFDGLATIIDHKFGIIVISKNMNVERKRFTLMHELGHLLLDILQHDEKVQEKLCNLFASEMLLSTANIIEEFGRQRSSITATETQNVQRKYGISFRAIVFKLEQVGIISKINYVNFYKKINFNPEIKKIIDFSRYQGTEKSDRYENLVLRAVAEEHITVSKASSLLRKQMCEIKEKLDLNIG